MVTVGSDSSVLNFVFTYLNIYCVWTDADFKDFNEGKNVCFNSNTFCYYCFGLGFAILILNL